MAETQITAQIAVCDGSDAAEIEQVTDALARLLPQLSSSSTDVSRSQVETIARHEACTLLIARQPPPEKPPAERQPPPDKAAAQIVGAMVLVLFPLPTGMRAWIEDVVVDESARGQGVGELLNRQAIELATAAGARTVDLTSRPSREAANRLYQRLGFEPRSTNVYRLELS